MKGAFFIKAVFRIHQLLCLIHLFQKLEQIYMTGQQSKTLVHFEFKDVILEIWKRQTLT